MAAQSSDVSAQFSVFSFLNSIQPPSSPPQEEDEPDNPRGVQPATFHQRKPALAGSTASHLSFARNTMTMLALTRYATGAWIEATCDSGGDADTSTPAFQASLGFLLGLVRLASSRLCHVNLTLMADLIGAHLQLLEGDLFQVLKHHANGWLEVEQGYLWPTWVQPLADATETLDQPASAPQLHPELETQPVRGHEPEPTSETETELEPQAALASTQPLVLPPLDTSPPSAPPSTSNDDFFANLPDYANQPSEETELLQVRLTRLKGSFGLQIAGGHVGVGVYVKACRKGGAAALDGRILKYDQLMRIDDTDVEHASHEEVVRLINQCGPSARLTLRRSRHNSDVRSQLKNSKSAFHLTLQGVGDLNTTTEPSDWTQVPLRNKSSPRRAARTHSFHAAPGPSVVQSLLFGSRKSSQQSVSLENSAEPCHLDLALSPQNAARIQSSGSQPQTPAVDDDDTEFGFGSAIDDLSAETAATSPPHTRSAVLVLQDTDEEDDSHLNESAVDHGTAPPLLKSASNRSVLDPPEHSVGTAASSRTMGAYGSLQTTPGAVGDLGQLATALEDVHKALHLEGWLMKQTVGRKSSVLRKRPWRRRYFILQDTILKYYKHIPQAGETAGVLAWQCACFLPVIPKRFSASVPWWCLLPDLIRLVAGYVVLRSTDSVHLAGNDRTLLLATDSTDLNLMASSKVCFKRTVAPELVAISTMRDTDLFDRH
ncbi:uncharacterized protein MONBRDRAFT_11659 [Monosiga brevicollis MX1]|uniref:PDZ domain-containing protein n=1 Tax=Monosiga brevicollis TaxID=81824 RepID=A9V9X2_MONBE|nr:uncharacterized protein MONBRDRAFT_11659 [Monosiga brevicollis MX1]EDQ85561.1 predicted protein [Monosiga brevicollis MX1]|eukprot:XP_001749510.1 hypothetical protein [Monosiga brevicollis MX1]